MAMTNNGTVLSGSQNLTGSAPTLSTEGQPLQDLVAITVVVETALPASQTLSGAGSLLCYVYDPSVGSWSRLAGSDFTVSLSGVARQTFDPVDVVTPRLGRVLWVPSGITVSAGTTVTVYQLGYSTKVAYVA